MCESSFVETACVAGPLNCVARQRAETRVLVELIDRGFLEKREFDRLLCTFSALGRRVRHVMRNGV